MRHIYSLLLYSTCQVICTASGCWQIISLENQLKTVLAQKNGFAVTNRYFLHDYEKVALCNDKYYF